MNILAVDDEHLALETLSKTIGKVAPGAQVRCCESSAKALELVKDFSPDVAFLDIEMPGLNGLELADRLKSDVNKRINIIFTTGYSEFVEPAFMKLRSSGYLMKPITENKVQNELANLRYPPDIEDKIRLRVRTFGNFDVFAGDEPLEFRYSKTRELFAYLVDSRSMCSNAQLQEALWEEYDGISDHGSYLQNIISDLRNTLKKYGFNDVLNKRYGELGLNTQAIDCDYYDYLEGKPEAIRSFKGEYMNQYSWAEARLGTLLEEMKK